MAVTDRIGSRIEESVAGGTTGALSISGVHLTNINRGEAISRMENLFRDRPTRARAISIVNAHTLNLAAGDPEYRAVLNRSDVVYGDGTGVRWAARMRGIKVRDNLVGTDLIPALFHATSGRGYRYFLLGAGEDAVQRAARTTELNYPGWTLAGCHHGYIDGRTSAAVIEQINRARPHLLLVGMGNPLQERWIDDHKHLLEVPVCVGIGGLLDHWAGNLRRAPRWVRNNGIEWVQILLQQPHKWRRYLLGNPRFLFRVIRDIPRDRQQMLARPWENPGERRAS